MLVTTETSFQKFLVFDPVRLLKENSSVYAQQVIVDNSSPAGKWISEPAFSREVLIMMHYILNSLKKRVFYLRMLRLNQLPGNLNTKDISVLQQSMQNSRETTVVHSCLLAKPSVYCAAFQVGKHILSLACWGVNPASLSVTEMGFSNFMEPSLNKEASYSYETTVINELKPTFFLAKDRVVCLWMKPKDWLIYCLANKRFHRIPLNRRVMAAISTRKPPTFSIPMASNPNLCSLYCASPSELEDSNSPRVFQIYRLLLKW